MIYDPSSKFDEIKVMDFDMIGKILDASIEEDCELPSCPSGYTIFKSIQIEVI